MNFHLALALRNSLANALDDQVDGGSGPGTISLYDGSQPATADTPVTTQRLLAQIAFSRPPFLGAVNGAIAANTIGAVDAIANGTASWARIADGSGNAVFDCDVGTEGATIILNTVAIVAYGPVVLTSFNIQVPQQ